MTIEIAIVIAAAALALCVCLGTYFFMRGRKRIPGKPYAMPYDPDNEWNDPPNHVR
jgi:hypothetical protein